MAAHKANIGFSAISAGRFLLLIILFTYIGAFICFASGSSINYLVFPLAVAASCGAELCISGLRTGAISTAIGICILVLTLIAATFINDASGDGIIYHQEIICHLLNGWNPFVTYVAGSPDPDNELIVMHYAKGVEIMGATVAKFTGHVESGKLINLLLIEGCGFLAYGIIVLRKIVKSKIWALCLTAMIIANPIGLSQSFSYYNDFAIYYMALVTLAIFLFRPYKLSLLQMLALAGVIVISASVKFTAFFYCGLTVLAVLIWSAVGGRWKFAGITSIVALVSLMLAVFVFCYHPYVTNYVNAGHPFYPLMGENTLDIMTGNTPEVYKSGNRWTNFWLSIFSVQRPTLAAQFAGFGILMGGMLILSFLILAAGAFKKKIAPVYVYAALFSFGACFIFEQSWWARYIPFLWLVPCIAAMAAASLSTLYRWISSILIACGVFTGLSFMAFEAYQEMGITLTRRYVAKIMQGERLGMDESIIYDDRGVIISRGVLSVRRNMNERGIETYDVNNNDIESNCIMIGLGGKVNAYIDIAKLPEVEQYFNNSLPGRLFNLSRFYRVVEAPDCQAKHIGGD